MDHFDSELHPIYGAIPSDGEFVHEGEVLGLSIDATELVTAPISGWVRLVVSPDAARTHLRVQIMAIQGERTALSSDCAR